MALWRVLDYTKLNADIAEIIFDLGFDWRKERDSLRDIILFACYRSTPLILLSFLLFLCRYHAGVANNRFIGCLVGLLLLLYMASFASRLPTRSNPLSATSKQNEQANFCLFVLFGGSEGIRTPEPVKTTRFPIVPVMTTSIRFHITFLF